MKTDREKQSLRGTVKAIRSHTTRFKEQEGKSVEEPWFGQEIIFNREGYVVEQVSYNPEGADWHTLNEYTGDMRLLASRSYDASGALVSERRYVYDEERRLIAEQLLNPDGEVSTPVIYTYDDAGQKTKMEEFNYAEGANLLIGIEGTNTAISAGEAKGIETLYDNRGEAVEVKAFGAGATLISRVEVTRDAHGNVLEETQYVGEVFPFGPCSSGSCSNEELAAFTEEQKAEFDAEIALLFAPGAPMSKHIHKYDEEGRPVESKLMMMGAEVNRQTYAYDEFGNKTEEVSYGEGDAFQTKAVFTREYDERSNWTKEIVSSAPAADADPTFIKPAHITRRFISYY